MSPHLLWGWHLNPGRGQVTPRLGFHCSESLKLLFVPSNLNWFEPSQGFDYNLHYTNILLILCQIRTQCINMKVEEQLQTFWSSKKTSIYEFSLVESAIKKRKSIKHLILRRTFFLNYFIALLTHEIHDKSETAAEEEAWSVIRGLENRQENHWAADTSPQDERWLWPLRDFQTFFLTSIHASFNKTGDIKSIPVVQTEEMTPVKKKSYLFAAGLFFHSQELRTLPKWRRRKEFLQSPI